jgi:hypothetical protein
MQLIRLLGFLTVFSVTGLACAANTVMLNCTGTLHSKETDFKDKPISPGSLFIDFDRKIVSGAFGTFSITAVTNASAVSQLALAG